MQPLVFALRVFVGAALVFAGALKVGHFSDVASAIAGFEVLPRAAVAPLAVVLPFFEIGLGLYLIGGLFARGAAVVACAQFLIYAAAIASAVVRHIPAACGCFGPGDKTQADWPHAFFDLAMAAVCAFVAWKAPGSLALDRRIRSE
ncbi:MAG: DoxX family membrane protein [Candidatus Eremiobacteraeota bacterium]|nr:DoxX family membrane protein [Candidatus Eremiobacteraeota bacterium]